MKTCHNNISRTPYIGSAPYISAHPTLAAQQISGERAESWRIVFVATGDTRDIAIRVKRVLKYAGRTLQMRCVDIRGDIQ